MSFIASTFLARIFNQIDKLKIILLFAFLLFGANSVFAQTTSKDSPVIITLDCSNRSWENKEPLIILFSDEYQGYFPKEEIGQINPEIIERMNVLKDDQATIKYGKSGKSGAIEIYLKEKTYKDLPKEIQKLMVKIKE